MPAPHHSPKKKKIKRRPTIAGLKEEIKMCLLCLEWEKDRMTSREILNAVGEMLDFSEDDEERTHLFGLVERVLDTEATPDYAPEIISFDELSDEEGSE